MLYTLTLAVSVQAPEGLEAATWTLEPVYAALEALRLEEQLKDYWMSESLDGVDGGTYLFTVVPTKVKVSVEAIEKTLPALREQPRVLAVECARHASRLSPTCDQQGAEGLGIPPRVMLTGSTPTTRGKWMRTSRSKK